MIGDVVKAVRAVNRPTWLLLGKGPTFSRYDTFYGDWPTLTLNHVCTRVPTTLAHFTDLAAFDDCSGHLLGSSSLVVLPWHPHVDMRPSRVPLDRWVEYRPALRTLEGQHRLLSYNGSNAGKLSRNRGLGKIHVRYFSAVAGCAILCAAGVSAIYSLGVDGGTGYAAGFDAKDCLANGRRSFDCQFIEIKRLCAASGATFRHLADGRG